jgi:hypothetical protein
MLQNIFMKFTCARRALSEDDLNYLASMLRVHTNSCDEITFSRFANASLYFQPIVMDVLQEPMSINAQFSFWTWLYSIMQLIKAKLLPVWDNGYLKGFVSETNAYNSIAAFSQNTFLLRFCDSLLGGVSVVFKGGNI